MAYDFNIKIESEYIRIEVSGERIPGNEKKDIVKVWNEVIKECEINDKNKILAIFNLKGKLPSMTAFYLGAIPSKIDLRRNIKLALVDTNEESRKENLFAVTVAVNRGYNAKVFDNENDAKKWLL